MRRLLAILLLTFPAAALAQTAGQVLFTPDAVINATECESATTTLNLTWQIDPDTVFSADGTVDVWVANRESTATTSPYCLTTDGVDGLEALQLANDLAAPTVTPSTPLAVKTRDLASVTALAACSSGTAYAYVCIEWRDVDGTPNGYARGTVTLKLDGPDQPSIAWVRAGEEALLVKILDGPDDAVPEDEYSATAVGPDTVEHSSGRSSSREVRIEGLENGVTYTVTAYTYSEEGNRSVGSPTAEGTPEEVLDAWEGYVDAGGRDAGGCQAGAAGLAALLGATALLRLRRRS